MKRTGCCSCPYGNWERELEIVQKFEPKLYKACMNIFGESYEYNRQYQEYKQAHLKKNLKKEGTK